MNNIINNNTDEFEEFLINRISRFNTPVLKIYKLNTNINMNQFLKILNLKPFYKNKIPAIPTTTPTPILNDTNDTNNISSIQKQHSSKSTITFHLEKECAICYEKIQENVYIRKLICNHEFHKKCIDKWLFTQFKQHKNEFTCPICRQSI